MRTLVHDRIQRRQCQAQQGITLLYMVGSKAGSGGLGVVVLRGDGACMVMWGDLCCVVWQWDLHDGAAWHGGGLASRGGKTCMGLHGGLAWQQWGQGGLAELCSMVV